MVKKKVEAKKTAKKVEKKVVKKTTSKKTASKKVIKSASKKTTQKVVDKNKKVEKTNKIVAKKNIKPVKKQKIDEKFDKKLLSKASKAVEDDDLYDDEIKEVSFDGPNVKGEKALRKKKKTSFGIWKSRPTESIITINIFILTVQRTGSLGL